MNHCKDCRWWGEAGMLGIVGPWTRDHAGGDTIEFFCAPCLLDKKKGVGVLGSDDCAICPKRKSVEIVFAPDFGCVHWDPKPPASGPDGGE